MSTCVWVSEGQKGHLSVCMCTCVQVSGGQKRPLSVCAHVCGSLEVRRGICLYVHMCVCVWRSEEDIRSSVPSGSCALLELSAEK